MLYQSKSTSAFEVINPYKVSSERKEFETLLHILNEISAGRSAGIISGLNLSVANNRFVRISPGVFMYDRNLISLKQPVYLDLATVADYYRQNFGIDILSRVIAASGDKQLQYTLKYKYWPIILLSTYHGISAFIAGLKTNQITCLKNSNSSYIVHTEHLQYDSNRSQVVNVLEFINQVQYKPLFQLDTVEVYSNEYSAKRPYLQKQIAGEILNELRELDKAVKEGNLPATNLQKLARALKEIFYTEFAADSLYLRSYVYCKLPIDKPNALHLRELYTTDNKQTVFELAHELLPKLKQLDLEATIDYNTSQGLLKVNLIDRKTGELSKDYYAEIIGLRLSQELNKLVIAANIRKNDDNKTLVASSRWYNFPVKADSQHRLIEAYQNIYAAADEGANFIFLPYYKQVDGVIAFRGFLLDYNLPAFIPINLVNRWIIGMLPNKIAVKASSQIFNLNNVTTVPKCFGKYIGATISLDAGITWFIVDSYNSSDNIFWYRLIAKEFLFKDINTYTLQTVLIWNYLDLERDILTHTVNIDDLKAILEVYSSRDVERYDILRDLAIEPIYKLHEKDAPILITDIKFAITASYNSATNQLQFELKDIDDVTELDLVLGAIEFNPIHNSFQVTYDYPYAYRDSLSGFTNDMLRQYMHLNYLDTKLVYRYYDRYITVPASYISDSLPSLSIIEEAIAHDLQQRDRDFYYNILLAKNYSRIHFILHAADFVRAFNNVDLPHDNQLENNPIVATYIENVDYINIPDRTAVLIFKPKAKMAFELTLNNIDVYRDILAIYLRPESAAQQLQIKVNGIPLHQNKIANEINAIDLLATPIYKLHEYTDKPHRINNLRVHIEIENLSDTSEAFMSSLAIFSRTRVSQLTVYSPSYFRQQIDSEGIIFNDLSAVYYADDKKLQVDLQVNKNYYPLRLLQAELYLYDTNTKEKLYLHRQNIHTGRSYTIVLPLNEQQIDFIDSHSNTKLLVRILQDRKVLREEVVQLNIITSSQA